MKNINKFVLTAIAVVSVAMILSTGISAAKQTSVRGTTSPLFKERTVSALNAGKQIQANDSKICIYESEEPKAVFGTMCAHVCTLARECSSCNVGFCTMCAACPVIAPPTPVKDFEVCALDSGESGGVFGTYCPFVCTQNLCTECNRGVCTTCVACPVTAPPAASDMVNSFQ